MRSKVTARMYSIYKVNGRGIGQGCQAYHTGCHSIFKHLALNFVLEMKRVFSLT